MYLSLTNFVSCQQALREAVIQSSTETEWLMTPPGQILHIEEAEEGGYVAAIDHATLVLVSDTWVYNNIISV